MSSVSPSSRINRVELMPDLCDRSPAVEAQGPAAGGGAYVGTSSQDVENPMNGFPQFLGYHARRYQ